MTSHPNRSKRTIVVTWQSPNGGTIDVTPQQERRLGAAKHWPRDHNGAEYCQVHKGRHPGEPTFTDAQIDAMCRG